MKYFSICLGLFLMTGSFAFGQPNAASKWEVDLQNLDKQIQDLSLKIDSYRHKSLDAEAEAQRVMLSDFTKYTAKIKEAEDYEELTRRSESQLRLLIDQRRAFIEAHSSSAPKAK